MINLFDKIYNSIDITNKSLLKLRVDSILRISVRLLANIFLPVYFKVTSFNKRYKLSEVKKTDYPRNIVSLTSFPARINRVWLVIESLLHQSIKPDKIILWLSNEQFNDIKSLPKSLLRLQNRGLEIRFCDDDLRSHKKYFYAFEKYPNDYIITVDDDVFYNSNLLSYLFEVSNRFPNSICCNEASFVAVTEGNIEAYSKWKNVIGEYRSKFEIIPIGVGGILYPPGALHKDVLNVELFRELCFTADDIWLNTMARLKSTEIIKTQYNSNYLPVMNINNRTLYSLNLHQGLNDIQLNKVRYYYKQSYGVDPYLDWIK